MMILGSPEEQAIPVGFITFEKLPEPKAPILIEAVDWGKYVPWIILGAVLLLPPKKKEK